MEKATGKPNSLPILSRLDNLERMVESLYHTLDSTFTELRNHVVSMTQGIEGVILAHSVTDPDFKAKVDSAIKSKASERATARAEREKSELESLVKMGSFQTVESISERSLIVGRLFDSSGVVQEPGRVQVSAEQLTPEARQAMVGEGVGFMYESPAKTKFEVLEIYEEVKAEPKTEPPHISTAPVETATDTPAPASV